MTNEQIRDWRDQASESLEFRASGKATALKVLLDQRDGRIVALCDALLDNKEA